MIEINKHISLYNDETDGDIRLSGTHSSALLSYIPNFDFHKQYPTSETTLFSLRYSNFLQSVDLTTFYVGIKGISFNYKNIFLNNGLDLRIDRIVDEKDNCIDFNFIVNTPMVYDYSSNKVSYDYDGVKSLLMPKASSGDGSLNIDVALPDDDLLTLNLTMNNSKALIGEKGKYHFVDETPYDSKT